MPGGFRTPGARRASYALLAIGLPLAGLVAWLPDMPGFRLKVLVLGVSIAALLVGIKVHRPGVLRPWLLLVAGLSVSALGDSIVLAMSADHVIASNVPIDSWLTAIGGALILAAILDVAGDAHGLEPGSVLDALLLAVAVWTLLWQLIMVPAGAPGWAGSGTEVAGGIQVLVYLAVMGMVARTVRIAPATARAAGCMLLIGITAALAAFLVGALREASSGVNHYAGSRAALGAVAYLMAAACGLHPSMRVLSERRRAPSVGFTPLRTVGIGLALATPPAVLLVSMWRGTPIGVTSLAVSWLILIPLVLVRLHLLGSARDRARAHADATERRMRTLVAHTGDLLLLVDQSAGATIRYANPASVRAVGRQPEALVGTSMRELVHDDDHHHLDAVLNGSAPLPRSADVRTHCGDGELRWMEIVGDSYEDEDGPALVLTLRDVTERKDEHRRWLLEAHRDALTGLANRRGLEQRFQKAFSQMEHEGGRLGVLLCDLDGFKALNDAAGHTTGDEILRHLAARFERAVRSDDLVGRLGGDEFLVVCGGLDDDPGLLEDVADRLLDASQQPFHVGNVRFEIGMSIGIAQTGRSDDSMAGLIERADTALYRAKALGRGRAEWAASPALDTASTALRDDDEMQTA